MNRRTNGKHEKSPGIVLFSVLFFVVGFLDMLWGASREGRFYAMDDIGVRISGLFFIILSVGLLRRMELARKLIIILCCASMAEALITLRPSADRIYLLFYSFLFAVPPVFYFCLKKTREQFAEYEQSRRGQVRGVEKTGNLAKDAGMGKLSSSVKIGLILAVVHFAYIFSSIISVIMRPAAQWQFVWLMPLIMDFPMSLIVILSFLFCPAISFHVFPYPVSELRDFLIPAFVFGVLGTVWYFYLPILSSYIFRLLKKRGRTAPEQKR